METNYILAIISFILAHFTAFMFGYKCADIENKKTDEAGFAVCNINLYSYLGFYYIIYGK